MRSGQFFFVIATIAFVGWAAPKLETAGHGDTVAQAQPATSGATTAHKAWLAGETALSRAPDGHFYADTGVNGQQVHMLVDTGASIVVLTAEDARSAGLDWKQSDIVVIGRGVNGIVRGVPVHLDRFELGGVEMRDVDAAVVPDGLNVSLLGQSLLSRLGGVRIEGDWMMVGARP